MNWTLEDGLKLIRAVQDTTKKFGFHITLGGSVLNKGESEKDIDLFFHPYNNPRFKEDMDGLITWLTELWGPYEQLGEEYDEGYVAPFKKRAIAMLRNEGGQIEPGYVVEWAKNYKPEHFSYDIETTSVYHTSKPKKIYRYKMKFERTSGDRIDIFIL